MRPQPDPDTVMPGWLRPIAPFSQLSAEALIVAAGHATLTRYRDNDVILKRGSTSEQDFFLIRGSVVLVNPDGNEQLIDSASAEAARAVAFARPCLYDVRACGQVMCASMPRSKVALLRDTTVQHGDAELSELEHTLSGTEDLWLGIKGDIEADRLRLPSQPDLAVKLRDAIARANCDNRRVADLVAVDPAIAAKVLRIANSPLCRGSDSVTSLADAISRIGMHIVSELVVCFSLKDLFNCASPSLRKLFAVRVGEAVRIGACASVVASRVAPQLADRALIAGLLSNIGAFPILERIAEREELLGKPQAINALTEDVSTRIGELICRRWNLGADVIDAVANGHDWHYTHSGDINLPDIVVCARFHAWLGLGAAYSRKMPHPEHVPAMRILGEHNAPQDSLAIVREARSRVDALLGALN